MAFKVKVPDQKQTTEFTVATSRKQAYENPHLEAKVKDGLLQLGASGCWMIETSKQMEKLVANVGFSGQREARIDLSHIGGIDTVGAWLLFRLQQRLDQAGVRYTYCFGSDEQERLLDQICQSHASIDIAPPAEPTLRKLVEDMGAATVRIVTDFGALLSFLGNVFARIVSSLLNPWRIRLTPLIHQMEVVGFRSLPIVGLISFLIGAVIVNQGAVQLRQFGAEIFVVNLVSIGVLRELGVLLTSVIIAGRSGSAFAAQIGSMVMHEEVDAMKTLGLNPIDVLVLPRLVALVLVLPLLTFYADIMGMLGGALMAWASLGITPSQFLSHMESLSLLNELNIGLIKSVFFAGVISVTGCFQGLTVEGTAESLGSNTTAAVVESIFLVIVLDAFFAVFFTTIGW